MVPLIGRWARTGSAAALAWILVAASAPDGSAPVSSFDFTDAVYLEHGVDPARIEDRLEERPGATVVDRAPAADRRPARALEVRTGYDPTGCTVFFIARGALRREGFRTADAQQLADRRRVFLFPRRGNPAQKRHEALFDTTSGVHPLGLWRAATVRFTDKAFTTSSGLSLVDEIRGRNGTDLDGTPILKHVSEVMLLERGGFVQVAARPDDGSAGAPWMVWPLWADPRRERPPADAYLDVLLRPGGSPVDEEVEQNFVCLQRTGDYLHRPMPRFPPFIQPLPIPAELPPAKSVELRLRPFAHRFHPDLPPSTLWGYGGTYPGPTVRVRRGEPGVLRCVNDLPAAGNGGFGHPWTSLRIDSGSFENAGFPGDFCKPGESRDHALTIPASGPSIGWYRDARLGFSAQNVYKGLAGLILATDPFDSGDENDPAPAASRLPSGPFDIPLVFAEKEFDTSLSHALAWHLFERDRFYGPVETINGAVQPFLRVARRKYRFRLLNAGSTDGRNCSWSNTRPWSNDRPFVLVGRDGGFLATPREIERVRLEVGERADVVVDFSAVSIGTELMLQSNLQSVLKVIVDRDAPDPSRIPARLPHTPPAIVPSSAPTRTFSIENPRGAWTVNGQAFDLAKPHARVKRGTTEIWAVKNRTGDSWIQFPTGSFPVLSFNGNPVRPEWSGVQYPLGPNHELQFLVSVGENVGRYVLPCSNQIHEDHGLVIRWDVEP